MNLANLSSPEPNTVVSKIKLLSFPIGKLNTAFHIDVVQKVVNFSTIYSSGLNHYGMATIEGEEITVIDLHKKFFNTPSTFKGEDKKYLLLVTNSTGEKFGIIVSNTPSLYDVSPDNIRALPPSYRQADTFKIASHVTMIEENENQITVFILDPDELVLPINK
ncbi:chemotaxis protein CheW [Cyanobacterium stanieri LEGE 03274]|uniref:Chemotaxis protein CheW n=1 Tax=Cyanobacterium stanieri LEGE 03274 TaxID=1828756 RepID=A0ABR9V227_9CHRO|nr:chemotaxis protein CheW [Cyanobacterium stanieri]MBE9221927.1 chemotaxis protein CheW [Cyanobacterium stanieri LEGE 03274]